ncbi:hypothetical protein PybrP1_009504 [[Pythium] brassicae (nom. inval.)]|nr:hypothetical protein PybrP1_009504 [[Pythium] brassicae (nom. inval.)]
MATPFVTLRGHRDSVNALLCEDAVRPHVLASGSDDGTARLWDVRTVRAVRSMNIRKALGLEGDPDAADADDGAVNALAFDATGDLLHAAAGNKVLTFDLRQDALVFAHASRELLQANADEVNALARHGGRGGRFLAAPDDAGDVRVYDMDAHRLFKTLSGHHRNICSAAVFRPHAPWDLVSGGLDGFVLFWDFSRGRMKCKLDLSGGVNELGGPGDAEASTAESNATSRLFNPPLVHALAFAPNGRSFAAGLGDASVAVVDFHAKRVVRRLERHRAAVSQVHFPAFRADDWLLSCGNDAKVCVWDYERALRTPSHSPPPPRRETDGDNEGNVANADLVDEFAVQRGPNAITTSLHQNLVWVADVSRVISAYPVL